MFKKILVPTDGSELADKALNTAIEFAKENQSSLIAMTVVEFPPHFLLSEGSSVAPTDTLPMKKHLQQQAEQHVKKLVDIATAAGVPCQAVIAQGHNPAQEIVNAAADNQCDVIFMTSHGRSGLNKIFLGSETQKVLANSAIPVLVLR